MCLQSEASSFSLQKEPPVKQDYCKPQGQLAEPHVSSLNISPSMSSFDVVVSALDPANCERCSNLSGCFQQMSSWHICFLYNAKKKQATSMAYMQHLVV
jgi:hypothetical protein